MTDVRVKKLEWVSDGFPGTWRSRSGYGGDYKLQEFKYGTLSANLLVPGWSRPRWYTSKEEAKAAAQADYERRVLSCLEVSDE